MKFTENSDKRQARMTLTTEDVSDMTFVKGCVAVFADKSVKQKDFSPTTLTLYFGRNTRRAQKCIETARMLKKIGVANVSHYCNLPDTI